MLLFQESEVTKDVRGKKRRINRSGVLLNSYEDHLDFLHQAGFIEKKAKLKKSRVSKGKY